MNTVQHGQISSCSNQSSYPQDYGLQWIEGGGGGGGGGGGTNFRDLFGVLSPTNPPMNFFLFFFPSQFYFFFSPDYPQFIKVVLDKRQGVEKKRGKEQPPDLQTPPQLS